MSDSGPPSPGIDTKTVIVKTELQYTEYIRPNGKRVPRRTGIYLSKACVGAYEVVTKGKGVLTLEDLRNGKVALTISTADGMDYDVCIRDRLKTNDGFKTVLDRFDAGNFEKLNKHGG